MYNKQDMVIAAIGKQDFLFFFNESRINILIDFLYLKINPNDLLEGLWSLWQDSELNPELMSSQNHPPSLCANGYGWVELAFIVSFFFFSNHI